MIYCVYIGTNCSMWTTLKMVQASTSEALTTTCQCKRRHIRQPNNFISSSVRTSIYKTCCINIRKLLYNKFCLIYNHAFLPTFSKVCALPTSHTQFRRLHGAWPESLIPMRRPYDTTRWSGSWLVETTLILSYFQHFWLPRAFVVVTKRLFVTTFILCS